MLKNKSKYMKSLENIYVNRKLTEISPQLLYIGPKIIYFKSLWIKPSYKYINMNVNVNEEEDSVNTKRTGYFLHPIHFLVQ